MYIQHITLNVWLSTRSNSFKWKSLMQLSHSTKPSTKKNWIDHSIFEVSQALSWVIEQSGTRIRNTWMEQNQMFQFQTVDGKCVSYWSSVKAFKVMQGPASFIISISELKSKINIFCEGRLEKPETGIRNRNGNENRNRNRNRKQQRNRNSNVKGSRYKNRDIIYFKLFLFEFNLYKK